jgi:class 3 adenylate cyclase
MQCPRCHTENVPQAKFCLECASPLARSCPSCGAPLPPAAKFCPECAHPVSGPGLTASPPCFASPDAYTPKHLAEKILTSKSALEGERKQVTVLFADLKGSMELLADRDPEEARKLLDPVLERMMEAVHHYEGTVNQVMGDGIMALFGAPLAHEDHAVRACYAALRMQEVVRRYSDELRRAQGLEVQIRVGLNSGDVVVRSIGSDLRMDYTAVGQTTHLAARMEQLAAPGSIRLTAGTLHLAEGFVQVTPLGPVPIKGLAEPVEVFELVGAGAARTRLEAAARRGLTRFVGRTAELEQLRDALDRARLGHGQVVAVVGEPGVGKSRLFWELTHSHRVHGWLIVQSASVSYGKATAYLPVIELLCGYFAIEGRDDPRKIREKVTGKVLTLAAALGPAVPALLALLDVPVDEASWHALDPLQRRQQTLDAVKRLLMRESEVQPLVVVVEDLHWIDGETQALLDGLVESLPAAPLLLLVNYRPEYRHTWGGKTYYRQLRIDPLPPESADELLDGLLGGDAALVPLKRLLVERTEANPLFLEESVRALVEMGALAGERRAYRLTGPVENLRIPATVQPFWPRASTASGPKPSASSRRPRSSARTCRCRSSWPLPTRRSPRCAPSSRAFRPRSSSTRPGSSQTSSTPSSTRSRTKSRTRGCSTTGSALSTPASPRRSSGSLQSASASRPNGWPTMPCGGSCGRRRSAISARRASGPWRGPRTARPSSTWSRCSGRFATSLRPGRRPS